MWVSYDEGLLNGRADMTTMKITAPTTSETAHPLYFDLIEVERRSLVNVYRISMQDDPHKYGGRHFFPRL